jgi:glutathione peroxidase
LQSDLDTIKNSGLQIVGISYDKVEPLAKFGEKENIQFPLLSDPESKVIRKLGILNSGAREGSKQYGIAHPMTIVIGKDSKVASVVPGTVRNRHSSEALVEAWGKVNKKADMKQNDANAADSDSASADSALAFKMKNIDGEEVELSKYKGKVVVMVNVASKCGMTPQYKPLQKLYDDQKDNGLVVLGFPCNQFGGQEPGTEEEIMTFCEKNYGVEFDMFSKVDVNGDDAAPLFKFLTAQDTKPKGAGKVRWNFEKFVIDRDGKLAGRFGTRVSPDSDDFLKFVTNLLGDK